MNVCVFDKFWRCRREGDSSQHQKRANGVSNSQYKPVVPVRRLEKYHETLGPCWCHRVDVPFDFVWNQSSSMLKEAKVFCFSLFQAHELRG